MARLFVGGLVGIVERQELEKVFSRFGRLEDVWVARKPPGFAFVQYAEQRDAEEAVQNLNNSTHFGTTIRVEFGMRDQGGRGRRSSPPRRGGPRGGPPRGGPPPPLRPDHDRYPPRRGIYGREYGTYRTSPPPPDRGYRSSPPRMYRDPPPRSSYQMSAPQRSYRPSPPPTQNYYSRSPQRNFRSSPPMRPVYRDPSPPSRPSYRGISPPRRYDYDTASRPLSSRDYSTAVPVYAGRSPIRAPRGYSPTQSTGPSYGSSAPSYSVDMSARYPGVRYRSRSRSPVGRSYY